MNGGKLSGAGHGGPTEENAMRNSIKAIVSKLETIEEQVADYLDNAEQAEYPNEDRIDKLQTEMDCIRNAIDSLEEIE